MLLENENQELKEEIEQLQSEFNISSTQNKELQSQIEQYETKISHLEDVITPKNEHEIIIDQRIPNEIIEMFKTYVEAINTKNVELMESTFADDYKSDYNFALFSGFTKEEFVQNETQYILLKVGDFVEYKEVEYHSIIVVAIFQKQSDSLDRTGGYFYLHHLLEEDQWNWKIVNVD
ncbi:hypothetical protein [Longirhabdus pacifica]|uniref:hypothetical protein n=1 Tax=Longirhabdus pacifica TaxID=2305227 RepID=UPI0010091B7E|nr:hypothetical protein [Longirhabdus pacifica]